MQRIRLAVLITFVIASMLVPSAVWSYTWFFNESTNHYYAVTLANETWEQAEKEAILAGGHLVTINDSAEENWLRKTFDNTYNYWIGFTDRQQEGNWAWSSGETVTHSNWAPNEPNNLNPSVVGTDWQRYYTEAGEDYAIMNWIIGDVAYWNDVPNLGPWFAQDGGGVTGFIEVSRVITPLPPSMLLVGPVLARLLWKRRACK